MSGWGKFGPDLEAAAGQDEQCTVNELTGAEKMEIRAHPDSLWLAQECAKRIFGSIGRLAGMSDADIWRGVSVIPDPDVPRGFARMQRGDQPHFTEVELPSGRDLDKLGNHKITAAALIESLLEMGGP